MFIDLIAMESPDLVALEGSRVLDLDLRFRSPLNNENQESVVFIQPDLAHKLGT